MSVLGQLVLTFGLLSLISIGGANATIPEIHRQVVDLHHWMDDATFASLVAIGQTAPGPNVLVVSMIGWQMAGIAGLLVATLAIVVPSSLIAFGLGRTLAIWEGRDGLVLTKRTLAPIALGFMLSSGIVMTRAVFQNALSLVIVAAIAAMLYSTRISPIWGILAGAACGVAGHRLHAFG